MNTLNSKQQPQQVAQEVSPNINSRVSGSNEPRSPPPIDPPSNHSINKLNPNETTQDKAQPASSSSSSGSVSSTYSVDPKAAASSNSVSKKKPRKKGCCSCCSSNKKGKDKGGKDGDSKASSKASIVPASGSYTSGRPRRTRVPFRPNLSMSLWGVIKNAIGKDLSKLPLPVHFNEPLSMLQRLTEDYEYSGLLDEAAAAKLSCDQMCYVAAFSVSSYASTAVRTGKPFNPLLGETYECDRMADLGFKCLCEQVSHHPPVASQHCMGKGWVCWQEFSMTSKFTGNSFEIQPSGIAHLLFTASGNHYTWRKVTTSVHNIILGSLWIDQHGEMDISNHTTGDKCHLKYFPTGTFGGNAKKVEGTVTNKQGQALRTLSGTWDKQLECFHVLSVSEKGKFTLGPSKMIWSRNPMLPDADKFYYFTLLACQLNEMEDDVAPTDSRRRPDQRLMENGLFDEANLEKVKLEDKQRTARKKREAAAKNQPIPPTAANSETSAMGADHESGYRPKWFELKKDPQTGKDIHMFTNEYWKCKETQDWSRCPDIY